MAQIMNGRKMADIIKQQDACIAPVPGDVGPVTIAMLLENTVRRAQNNQILKHPLMMW
jgi:5,10-methylene-tetrahydrofolate dehydrogenase/methenyl tetrahydrofolate cyclohydrolase